MEKPICAPATSSGRAAISVIRLSGEGVLERLANIFTPHSKKFQALSLHPRMAIWGKLFFKKHLIDEVIVIPFVKPHSYTGEEAAEIHTHGNPIIVRKTLEALYHIGFDKAPPGEFTKRAFLSGKMDLTQAQAVHEIIQAKTEFGVQNALQLREGRFRKILLAFRSDLLNLLADLSAELDFIEEDITFSSKNEKLGKVEELISAMEKILDESRQLKIFREGLEIMIVGAPNVGKSSLLNFLAGEQRAIVSKTPGTTRDYIEVELNLEGLPVHFIDTAGIREIRHNGEHDEIEKIGIEKTLQKITKTDLLIIMLDGSLPMDRQEFSEKEHILLVNKKDVLHPSWKNHKEFIVSDPARYKNKVIFISLRTGENTEGFKNTLKEMISQRTPAAEGIMMSSWQADIFSKIISELKNTKVLLESQEAQEIIVSSLQITLDDLSQLTGEISNEEILGRIFSRFCIGK